jgi:hypothetical protein
MGKLMNAPSARSRRQFLPGVILCTGLLPIVNAVVFAQTAVATKASATQKQPAPPTPTALMRDLIFACADVVPAAVDDLGKRTPPKLGQDATAFLVEKALATVTSGSSETATIRAEERATATASKAMLIGGESGIPLYDACINRRRTEQLRGATLMVSLPIQSTRATGPDSTQEAAPTSQSTSIAVENAPRPPAWKCLAITSETALLVYVTNTCSTPVRAVWCNQANDCTRSAAFPLLSPGQTVTVSGLVENATNDIAIRACWGDEALEMQSTPTQLQEIKCSTSSTTAP